MSKLSTLSPLYQPLVTTVAQGTYTGNFAPAYSRDPKSELFLLSISNMVGEDTFYEGKTERDSRFRNLISDVTRSDPDWVRRFVPFLRDKMNMRSASIVMAVEYVIAGGKGGRQVIDSAISRADEPGEVLGYARHRLGRSLPQPIKRGVADAVTRLYNERNVIKYTGKGYTMKDVLRVVHPAPIGEWQSQLFRYVTKGETGTMLGVIARNREVMSMDAETFRAQFLPPLIDGAALTWEQASSKYGKLDARFWEVMIPNMGYMALLRNLRNFEDAGISEEAKAQVVARLTDPEAIRKSRQFPIRFYSAYKAVRGFSYYDALERALDTVVENIPVLKGKTLIMVDNSGSMSSRMSTKSDVTMREIAGLFGAALAKRCEDADLVPYAERSFAAVRFTNKPVLKVAEDATRYDGGTNTYGSIRSVLKEHDRVVILTDEQTSWYHDTLDDVTIPFYTFNLVGYRATPWEESRNRVTIGGGLTDAAFQMIPLIEAGRRQEWPF